MVVSAVQRGADAPAATVIVLVTVVTAVLTAG
jgi:hypothetical protein